MERRSFARSPYVLTERRIALWAREGRGCGDGADYRPWLTTRNVRSSGRKHRMRGILHDRVLHLMSDLERNAMLHFERQPVVSDVREQFPLDRDITRRIARAMGVTHPTDPKSGTEIVMTTDLLVTFARDDSRPLARPFSVKEASDMSKPRTLVKQEIERRYWAKMGFRWKPLFENVLRDGEYFEALRWIRDWFYVDRVGGIAQEVWRDRAARVRTTLSRCSGGTVGDFVRAVERGGGFDEGEVLSILRHLAARKLVDFDPRLGVPTLLSPLSRFTLPSAGGRLAA